MKIGLRRKINSLKRRRSRLLRVVSSSPVVQAAITRKVSEIDQELTDLRMLGEELFGH